MAKGPSAPGRNGLLSAVIYGAVAIACNFVNKSAMLVMPHAPNLVILAQLLAMYVCAHLVNAGGLVTFPAFTTARFRQLLPLSLMYTAHASMVLRSLLFLNVAMYNTLKRMTPVLVLTFKSIAESKLPGVHETACVCVIVGGCIIAGAGDLAFTLFGYSAALFCAALQATLILLAEANDKAGASASAPLLPSHTGLSAHAKTLAMPNAAAATSAVEMAQQAHGDASVPSTFIENVERLSRGGGGSPSKHHAAHAIPLSRGSSMGAEPADLFLAGGNGSAAPPPPQQQQQQLAAEAAVGASGSRGTLSSSVEALYYTAVSGLPVMSAVSLLTGELAQLPRLPALLKEHMGGSLHATAWALMVAFAETVLAGSMLWCTSCNSALTTSIVGVLKGAVAVVLGSIFMAGPARMTLTNASGIAIVLAGGVWYTSLKSHKHR